MGASSVDKYRAAAQWTYLNIVADPTIVNAGQKPATVEISMPDGSADLVSGEKFGGRTKLALGPFSLRSFSAPKGAPSL